MTDALGLTTVYDSVVHGSWQRMRDRTNERRGSVSNLGQREWILGYLEVRRDWLATHAVPLLRKTVYRMDALHTLADTDNWDLNLPCLVRQVRLEESLLGGRSPRRVSAQDSSERTLSLTLPFTTGDDVADVQAALTAVGFKVDQDGIYGALTEATVRRFQQGHGLKPDGIVGPSTRAALGL